MNVDDILALNICEEYNRERLVELFGEGEFTWREIVNCNGSIGDKVICLFRPEFLLVSDMMRIALEFLDRAPREESEEYFKLRTSIASGHSSVIILALYDTYKIYRRNKLNLLIQSEWLLQEIVKCLQ